MILEGWGYKLRHGKSENMVTILLLQDEEWKEQGEIML